MKINESIKKNSQTLRKNATKEENTLWYQYLRHYPLQFRRQHPFGQYIVDFYCAKAKLVIELDGLQHYEEEGFRKDAARTAYLESLGLKVLRFSNRDVNHHGRHILLPDKSLRIPPDWGILRSGMRRRAIPAP